MSVKIRLQRGGRKKRPFYQIVVADSRAPRDGKFIERIGSYNPTTDPATIELDLDNAVNWLQKGAQPTDTARAILSYKGAMYKNHLLKGVAKGALTEEQVEAKFAAWLESKTEKIEAKRGNLQSARDEKAAAALIAEKARNEAREKAILAKNSELSEEVEANAEGEEVVVEEGAEVEASAEEAEASAESTEEVAEEPAAEAEASSEEPAAEVETSSEEPAAEVETSSEEPAAEAEETPAEEEAPAEEKTEEAPAEEEASEETAEEGSEDKE